MAIETFADLLQPAFVSYIVDRGVKEQEIAIRVYTDRFQENIFLLLSKSFLINGGWNEQSSKK